MLNVLIELIQDLLHFIDGLQAQDNFLDFDFFDNTIDVTDIIDIIDGVYVGDVVNIGDVNNIANDVILNFGAVDNRNPDARY